jgi:PPP family 3-phenylpropionic acid transporter
MAQFPKLGYNRLMPLIPAYITTFIVYGAVTPYIPLLIRGLGYSPVFVGVLLGVFEGGGIAGPFIFGYFADKMGRYKPGLIVTYALTIAPMVPLALFIKPWASVLLIAIFALGYKSTIPLMEAVTTITLGNTGNYGKIRTAGSASFILMVLFLQWTPFLRPNTPFHICFWIILTAAPAVGVMALTPAKYTTYSRSRNRKPGGPREGSIWSPLFILGFIMIALSRIAMSPVYSFFPLYLTEFMGWDAVGLMFALSAASEIPLMFVSRSLIRRFGSLRLLALASAAIGVRLLIYALFPTRPAIIIAQLLHSLCFGVFHPAAISLIASCVPPERRALGMSLYLSVGTGLPYLVGNTIGGFIVEYAGYRTLFASFTVFSVLAMGVYLFILPHRGSGNGGSRLPDGETI